MFMAHVGVKLIVLDPQEPDIRFECEWLRDFSRGFRVTVSANGTIEGLGPNSLLAEDGLKED
jgi:hypothetical protein